MPDQRTVLIVDDDHSDSILLKRQLLKLGVRAPILSVYNATDAMHHIRGAMAEGPRPTLVFVDIAMPQINGFAFVAWIRSQAKLRDIYIAVLSGSQIAEDKDKARLLGAQKYLVKPASDAEVLECMRGSGIAITDGL